MKIKSALLTLLLLASLGCGLLNTAMNQVAGGGQNYQQATGLWSDVPPMDGLQPSPMDLPLPVKLIMRTILGNLGKLNPQGQDQTTGNIDWVAFTTTKTPADVEAFYTNARMVAAGWDDAGQDSTCVTGSDSNSAQLGSFCAFQKQKDNIQLAIIITQDAKDTKQTDVFFLRLQANPTPAP